MGSTYGSTSSESLNDAAFGVGLDNLGDVVLSLGNLELVAQSLAGQLEAASSSNTVKDQLIVERSSDDLLLAVLALPDDEEVAGTGLGTLALSTVQPENLMVAASSGIGGGQQGRTVVSADLGVAEATNPGADHVVGRGVKSHSTGGSVQAGHEGDNDVEEGGLGSSNAELRSGANDGRSDVQEVSRLVLGEPLGTIDGKKGDHELLDLGGLEDGEGDSAGRHSETSSVAVRTEDAELAIVTAVDLETLEALGSVVQDRGGGHEAQRTVGLELGSSPAGGLVPGSEDHVVGGDGLVAGVGRGLIGDGAGVLGVGVGELGGVEGRLVGLAVGDGRLSGLLLVDGGGRQVDVLGLDSGGSHGDDGQLGAIGSSRGVVGVKKR